MIRSTLIAAFLLTQCCAQLHAAPSVKPGKDSVRQGRFYFSWGYNKDWFSKSTMHFYDQGSGNYNFTLSGVRAKDRTGFANLLRSDLTVPQYVYRVGYYVNERWGFEINFDHTKYVIRSDQMVHFKGMVHDKYFDQDTLLTNKFLAFEHTDGANFLMLNYLMRRPLIKKEGRALRLDWVFKPGGGVVIPRTRVVLFGETLDNKFHLAGWIAGVESGLRFSPWKYFFTEATVKGSFANYSNVLVIGDGKANHHFWCTEIILNAGIQLPL